MTDSNKNQDNPVTDDDWTSALGEQAAASSAAGGDDAEAAWAEAMAEQAQAERKAETADTDGHPAPSGEAIFKPLQGEAANATPRGLDMIMEIPVTLSVQLGATRLTIRELLDLAKGSIVELDGLAGEPMDILINGYLIAQGEVVVVDDKYGIRITEIITRAERIHKLNQ